MNVSELIFFIFALFYHAVKNTFSAKKTGQSFLTGRIIR